MARIVPEPRLELGLGAEKDAAAGPQKVNMLAAHDVVTTNSRKVQHNLVSWSTRADMLCTQLR